MKPEDYANSVSALNADEAAAREYAKHNWTLAAIASAKFAAIGTATRFLRWMLVAAAVYACVAIAAAVPTAVRAAAAPLPSRKPVAHDALWRTAPPEQRARHVLGGIRRQRVRVVAWPLAHRAEQPGPVSPQGLGSRRGFVQRRHQREGQRIGGLHK